MDKVKKDHSHVKDNFTFALRSSKLSIISGERDLRDLTAGLMKMLVQESTVVNGENYMFRNYWGKNREAS